jgi:hypothetical protein
VIVGISEALTEEYALSRRPVLLREFDLDGRAGTTLAELPGEEYFQRRYPEGGSIIAVITQPIMTHGARHTKVGSRLVAGSTDRFEIRVFQADLGLERIIRAPFRDRPVDPDEWEEAIAERLADADTPDHRATALEVIELSPVPEVRPAYGQFVPDSEGYVWVEPYRPAKGAPVPWLVVDLEGEILGDVLLPAGFHPTEIGFDYVLGIVRDEFDVPYVRMYALDRAVRGDRGPST